jgi:hypothetical protein
MLYVIAAFSVSEIGVIFVLRWILVSRSTQLLASDPQNSKALNTWRTGYLAIYAVSLSIAIYGLMLHFMGFGFPQIVLFFIAGFVLILCFPPRAPIRPFTP